MMIEILTPWVNYIFGAAVLILALLTIVDILLRKRESGVAVGWVGIVVLVPVLGIILYWIFGVNRIKRRARRRRSTRRRYLDSHELAITNSDRSHEHLAGLFHLLDHVTDRKATTGNHIDILADAAQALDAMLEAIETAEETITLQTYIFDVDTAGKRFVNALAKAHQRGVEVRVLVDSVGSRYSFPSIVPKLRRLGIPCARFLPNYAPWHWGYANLRTHRKILVADGHTGFTGGLNIRENYLKTNGRGATADTHFRIQGPVVSHLQETFAEDWSFTTGEPLKGQLWFPRHYEAAGDIIARGICDGPDEDYEKLRWILLGAIAVAEKSIEIVTPYFVPDDGISQALEIAAMRGVKVSVIVPEKSNLRLATWGGEATYEYLLRHDVQIHLSPSPFDHSKLFLIDRIWALIGSANWDARSLELNFEFNVECYGEAFAAHLGRLIDNKRNMAQRLHLVDVQNWSLPRRLRNKAVYLFSPYL